MSDLDYRVLAREFVRALRGKRSQLAASRRLAYTSNVWAEWESGRRVPLALDVIGACRLFGVDLELAFASFGGRRPSVAVPSDRDGLSAWLSSLRGDRSLLDIATQSGLSRHQVSRFLSGKTQPRLHEFFKLVDVCTPRLPDLVARLVPIARVPTLKAQYERIVASRALSLEQPWSTAILVALDALPALTQAVAVDVLSRGLTLPEKQVADCLEALEAAFVIAWTDTGVRVTAPLLVDTGANPEGARRLRHHWSRVAAERAAAPQENDLFSYNLFSISRADFQKLRAMQREYYRRVRELIADSPPETAALLNLQLMEWDVGRAAKTLSMPRPERPASNPGVPRSGPHGSL